MPFYESFIIFHFLKKIWAPNEENYCSALFCFKIIIKIKSWEVSKPFHLFFQKNYSLLWLCALFKNCQFWLDDISPIVENDSGYFGRLICKMLNIDISYAFYPSWRPYYFQRWS